MEFAGRANGRLGDRDVSGGVEERQEDRFRYIGAERRASIRGGVVQQPEVRLRGDDVPGREQGGGQVQEQRVDHQPEEEASVPYQIGQVPREDRGGGERGSKGEQDSSSEGGYRDIEDGDSAWKGRVGRHGSRAGERGLGVGPADGETVRARFQAAGPREVEEQGDTQVRATASGHGSREEYSSQGGWGGAAAAAAAATGIHARQEPVLVSGGGVVGNDHGQQRDAVDQEGEHEAAGPTIVGQSVAGPTESDRAESIAAEPVVAERARESGHPCSTDQPAAPQSVEPERLPVRPPADGSEPCPTGLSQQYTESVSADQPVPRGGPIRGGPCAEPVSRSG